MWSQAKSCTIGHKSTGSTLKYILITVGWDLNSQNSGSEFYEMRTWFRYLWWIQQPPGCQAALWFFSYMCLLISMIHQRLPMKNYFVERAELSVGVCGCFFARFSFCSLHQEWKNDSRNWIGFHMKELLCFIWTQQQ